MKFIPSVLVKFSNLENFRSLSQMSEDGEIERLYNTLEKCLEKLTKYNYFLHHSSDIKDTNNTASFASETINFSFNIRNTITSIGEKLHLHLPYSNRATSKKENSHHERYIRRKYVHHFGSFEAFFNAYITKLEQKYTRNLPLSRNRPVVIESLEGKTPEEILKFFDTYSYSVLKIDAIYWRAGGLRDHYFVRKGGTVFLEGIERMQARAVRFLEQYDRIMKGAPDEAVRVVLISSKEREKLRKKSKSKKWIKGKFVLTTTTLVPCKKNKEATNHTAAPQYKQLHSYRELKKLLLKPMLPLCSISKRM
ncbi:hypothetical protein G9A89_021115 [Geosiphon pyriformis]|nr:hypothetical protein G9A89_021115 [Geosiphon pyriformis]